MNFELSRRTLLRGGAAVAGSGLLAACALGLYARTTVVFRPLDRERRMPLLLAFVLIGFFILALSWVYRFGALFARSGCWL